MRLVSTCRMMSIVAATFFFVSNVNAAMLVRETFTYADGDLVGEDPPVGGAWNVFSGSGGTDVLVTSGKVATVQGAGSREDVSVPFEGAFALGAGGVVYSGFDLTVADPGAAITDVYFAGFLEGSSLFDSRIWITAPTTSGYRLALSNDNSITDVDGEIRSGDLAFGTTYRVITKYDYDAKAGKFWIDPVNESSAGFAATDPGFSDEVGAYMFRQAGGNTTQVLDNLFVSTTFEGALTGTEIPEPFIGSALVVAAIAFTSYRRLGR